MIEELYESEHTWDVQEEASEHGLWAEELARLFAFTLGWELTAEKWTACLPSGKMTALSPAFLAWDHGGQILFQPVQVMILLVCFSV